MILVLVDTVEQFRELRSAGCSRGYFEGRVKAFGQQAVCMAKDGYWVSWGGVAFYLSTYPDCELICYKEYKRRFR